MLACVNCGHVFDEDDAIHETEYTGVTSEAWSEKFDITKCPECGGDWVEEAIRCDFCGAFSVENVCSDCRDLITIYLRRLVEHGMSMHRINGIKPDRFDVINAIAEVLEEIE